MTINEKIERIIKTIQEVKGIDYFIDISKEDEKSANQVLDYLYFAALGLNTKMKELLVNKQEKELKELEKEVEKIIKD